MHALTVIVEFAAIAAVLLIDKPVEPHVAGTIGGPATWGTPPDGFESRKLQQCPMTCWLVTSIGILGVVLPAAAIAPYLAIALQS